MKEGLPDGQDQELQVHDLRHALASRLVQAGFAIQVVKDLLGHQDITTTMRCAHFSPADLRDAVEKLAPKKEEPKS